MSKTLRFSAILAGLTPVLASVLIALVPAFVLAEDSTLPNGIYLVLREAENSKSLGPAGANERILIDDGHFLEPNHPNLPDKPRFVALSTEHFIPMNLAQKPTKKVDTQGKKQLLLELAKGQVVPLETFTRENCGRSVAIIALRSQFSCRLCQHLLTLTTQRQS